MSPLRTLACTLALALATAPVLAGHPEWVGKSGHDHKHHLQHGYHQGYEDGYHDALREYHADTRRAPRSRSQVLEDARYDRDRYGFTAREREIIRDYYLGRARTGHCPPGFAKKHKGCQPPGHARAWVIGEPLPRDVAIYPLPTTLLRDLPPPPPNYRYARVAGDILLLTTGTNMVIDALDDLFN